MRSVNKECKKWRKWIMIIHQDTTQIDKTIKWYNQEIIDHQTKVNSFFKSNYKTTIAMGVRRQIGTQKDEISLLKLLKQVNTHYFKLERSGFLNGVDKNSLTEDIDILAEIIDQVGVYIDRKIAHLDRRFLNRNIKIKDIEKTFTKIVAISNKYYKKWGTF